MVTFGWASKVLSLRFHDKRCIPPSITRKVLPSCSNECARGQSVQVKHGLMWLIFASKRLPMRDFQRLTCPSKIIATVRAVDGHLLKKRTRAIVANGFLRCFGRVGRTNIFLNVEGFSFCASDGDKDWRRLVLPSAGLLCHCAVTALEV